MDLILNRYRNLTALVAAILVQLVLLAYQVKRTRKSGSSACGLSAQSRR